MMMRSKSQSTLGFVLILASILSFSLPGYTQEGLKQHSMNFTGVAKKAIPAVVSIQVKAPVKQRGLFFRNGQSYESDEPFDFFGDNFFNHFFGTPRRPRERSQERQQTGQASGFIISEDGLIITNNHVVENAAEINVLLNDGREFKGEMIGQDPNTDVALVKIDAKDLPHLKLGDSDNLEVGQWVVAIGNPLGLQASLTVGVVSATGRNNLDLARIEDFIQTDAAINRGNSGGPLLNLDGDVIGINTAIVTNMATGGYMGIGFAIPSNIAQHIVDELLKNGSVTRGFMGVTLQKIDQDLALAFDLDKVKGALVSEVSKGSPAEKAGLRQGDVILRYNNRDVKDISSLRNAISLMKPGTRITLTVLRNDRTIIVPLTVGSYPDDETKVAATTNKLGIEVNNLTPEIAHNLGFINERGVVVSKVEPNSVANWAGIRKGALIVSVNKQEVSSVDEFNKALTNADSKKPLLLLVKQGEQMRYISLKVG